LIPNEVYKVTPPSNRVLRISSAALDLKGIAKDSKASLIVFDATKSQEFVICTLISGVLPHTHLDLFFVADREVTFKVSGNSNINLTGYTTFIEPGLMGPDSESDLEMPMPTSLPTQDVPKKKSKKKMEDPSANGEDKESAKNVKKGKKKKDKGSHKTIVDELEGGLLEGESSEGEGMIGTHGAHDLALGLDPDADDDSLLGGDIPKAAKKKEKKKRKGDTPNTPNTGKKSKVQNSATEPKGAAGADGPKPKNTPKPKSGKGSKGASPKTSGGGGTLCTICNHKFANEKSMQQHAIAKHKETA